MELHAVDNIVTINTPGMRDQKKVFPDVRAALDWVETMVQTKPIKYSVTVNDVGQLFSPDQQEAFKFVYDTPAQSSHFQLDRYIGSLVQAAIYFWWKSLPPLERHRLKNRADALVTEINENPSKQLGPGTTATTHKKRRRGH